MTPASVAQSALDPAGPAAVYIARLWWLMFWLTTAVFVVTIGFLAWGVLRGRRPPPFVERRRQIRPDPASDRALTGAVAMAVGATVVILFGVLLASFLTERAVSARGAASAVTIDITGYQWWWQIEYEDPNPSLRVTTANEIHIPIGRPVALKVTSRDVIHSFWVPNLQGKRDLIPGYTTAIWIQADRPGVFRGQCAEFCGYQHAHMAFYVTAESDDEFQRWLTAQRAEAATPSSDTERHGRDVFLSSTCTQCHTIRGTIAGARLGPDLTHVASRGTIAAGTLPNTVGHLAGWVSDSQSIKPGNRMPPNAISGDDLQALLVYLERLK
jgi:cytochrome c oxidase subunit 2